MWGLLAVIGLGVVLWWISKGLKKLAIMLENASVTMSDYIMHSSKIQNKRVARQNIIAEKKLHNITGDGSHASYTHQVREEIERLIKESGQ